MTPLSFEWQWTVDYFIFMGLLYIALLIVGGGLIFTYIKSWLDLSSEEGAGESEELSYRSRYSNY